MGNKSYAHIKKIRVGPGGLSCPCCNPYCEHPRKSKPKFRRHRRRADKLMLRRQIREEL